MSGMAVVVGGTGSAPASLSVPVATTTSPPPLAVTTPPAPPVVTPKPTAPRRTAARRTAEPDHGVDPFDIVHGLVDGVFPNNR